MDSEITNVEVDAMLEVAPKYCTHIRECQTMKTILPEPTRPTMREDVPISSSSRVFLLHNLLTPEECQHYIRETEALVYRDLDGEFDADYRSNQRVLVLSEKLADHIYARMKLQLNRSDVLRVRPMCFGNSGTWKPVRLNECFKFGKYQQKQHFGTHIDGPWVPRTDESSIYTVLIYLNDDFTGGRTVFIPEEQRSQMDAKITEMRRTQCEEYDQIGGGGGGGGGAAAASVSSPFVGYTTNADGVVSILPRRGSALLFTHDTLHAGLPIITGCKYVMRTELMFHRVDSEMIPPSIRDSYVNDPAYQRTLKFYRESHEKNMKGDVTGFTNSYLEALKLQHQAQLSIAPDTRAIHQMNLPIALYIHTFTFLTCQELGRMLQVSKSYKDLAQDGVLWKRMYREYFPLQVPMITSMKKLPPRTRARKEKIASVAQQQEQHPQQQLSSDDVVEEKSSDGTVETENKKEDEEKLESEHTGNDDDENTAETNENTNEDENVDDDENHEDAADVDDENTQDTYEDTTNTFETQVDFSNSAGFTAEIDPAIEDWYTMFKQRIQLTRDFSPLIVDFGSVMTKATVVDVRSRHAASIRGKLTHPNVSSSSTSSSSTTPSSTTSTPGILSFPSCLARVPGVFDLHMRQMSSQRTPIGHSAIEKYPDWVQQVFQNGLCSDLECVLELLSDIYLNLGIWSFQHPLLLAEPPFQWSDTFKDTLTKLCKRIFRIPTVAFVNSALLTMLNQCEMIQGSSCIVAHVGTETAWVSGLGGYRQHVLADFTHSLTSSNKACNEILVKKHTWMKDRFHPDKKIQEMMNSSQIEKEQTKVDTISPELLARAVIEVYLRTLKLSTDTANSPSSTLHNVILIGGGTLDTNYRTAFETAIQTYNRTRSVVTGITNEEVYQSLVCVTEWKLDDDDKSAGEHAHPASDLLLLLAASDLKHTDLLLRYPLNPLTTVLEGGRVFSGLPQFKEYCIETCDIQINEKNYWVPGLNPYKECWNPCVWLNQQMVYSTISSHFHYDPIEQAYIANTSCDEEEYETILRGNSDKSRDGKDSLAESFPQSMRVVCRRRLKKRRRGKKEKMVTESSASSSTSASLSTTTTIIATSLLPPRLPRTIHAYARLSPFSSTWYEQYRSKLESHLVPIEKRLNHDGRRVEKEVVVEEFRKGKKKEHESTFLFTSASSSSSSTFPVDDDPESLPNRRLKASVFVGWSYDEATHGLPQPAPIPPTRGSTTTPKPKIVAVTRGWATVKSELRLLKSKLKHVSFEQWQEELEEMLQSTKRKGIVDQQQAECPKGDDDTSEEEEEKKEKEESEEVESNEEDDEETGSSAYFSHSSNGKKSTSINTSTTSSSTPPPLITLDASTRRNLLESHLRSLSVDQYLTYHQAAKKYPAASQPFELLLNVALPKLIEEKYGSKSKAALSPHQKFSRAELRHLVMFLLHLPAL